MPLLLPPQEPPRIALDRDDFVLDGSALVVPAETPLPDVAGDGVLRVTGDDVVLDFQGAALRGAAADAPAEELSGVGILVTGKRVTVRNARVSGYKVGILAVGADGLVVEDCDVSGNFAQRLGSTPEREDPGDWLWPHENDAQEWRTRYGAGICVEDARDVTVRRCRARRGQNGLLLDRVAGASVYDNDFSFLSGWGVALWRSSDNVVARNALDFCVRGYSHGVYNRGQDSAGILVFEQCSRNVFAENSATHGGDGFFAFAGKEALGERPPPERPFDYARRGNDDNLIVGNDFSYAAAHGLELTFSFGNRIVGNRLSGNAICGIWGGYSRDTLIAGNTIEENGDAGYGLERGGVNVEHGQRNRIERNTFRRNACGVHLFWDPDEALAALPWSRANGHACEQNAIVGNAFEGDALAIHLRDCGDTLVADNELSDVGAALELEGGSEPSSDRGGLAPLPEPLVPALELAGETRPVGARARLAGRESIVITETGPYDWERPLLVRAPRGDAGTHAWRLLGGGAVDSVAASAGVRARLFAGSSPPVVEVAPERDGAVAYELTVVTDGVPCRGRGHFVGARWRTTFFAWREDPREHERSFRAAAAEGVTVELPALELDYRGGGPSELAHLPPAVAAAELPRDRFGTLAETRIALPAGRWDVETLSDDGIRVRVDGEVVIDDWTWHAPTRHVYTLELAEAREIALAVEHFELDGHAALAVTLRPAD